MHASPSSQQACKVKSRPPKKLTRVRRMPRRWLAGWQNPRNNEPAIYVNTSDTWNKGLCTKQISDFPQTASRKLDFYYNLRRRKVSDVEKSRAAHHFLSTTCPILATAGKLAWGKMGGRGVGVESMRGKRKLRSKLPSTLFEKKNNPVSPLPF